MSTLRNFLHFCRLHTVIGTTLSIICLWLLALSFSISDKYYFSELLLTLVSCLGANIYIVGLNQVTDVEIDRINKPYLPLASGAFSMRTGYSIIIVSVLISLIIAIYLGHYLLWTVLLSLALGTAYSLPPIRLKRFHFWAAFCIIAVRGLIVNLLLFLHFNFIINSQHNIPLLIWLLTATIFIYSIVIAWFKDIPDMEGDRHFHINTLTLRLGAKTVFNVGNGLVTAVYLALIILPFFIGINVNVWLFAGAHILLLVLLYLSKSKVALGDRATVFKYYQFFWVLFFLEYITFAGAGLLA